MHLALTNCAGALWNLHGLLTSHAGVESRVVTARPVTSGRRYPQDILLSAPGRVAAVLEAADVVHFHNTLDWQSPQLAAFRGILERKPALLQLHSEPAVLRSCFPGRPPELRRDLPVLVVAQKQARFCRDGSQRRRPARAPAVALTSSRSLALPAPPALRGASARALLAGSSSISVQCFDRSQRTPHCLVIKRRRGARRRNRGRGQDRDDVGRADRRSDPAPCP